MGGTHDTIIDATMSLLEEHPFDLVTHHAIADRAGITLAELAAAFATRGDILDAWSRRIDGEVLRNDVSDMADEAPRERLFDVLMSRIDALRPYRGAVRGLMQSVRRDPALGLLLNSFAVRSHAWMLSAAGIDATGWRGRLVVQGMAVAFLRVLRVFVSEDDPGLPRTMAALDRELRDAEARLLRFSRFFGPVVKDRREPVPMADAYAMQANGSAASDPISGAGFASDTASAAAGPGVTSPFEGPSMSEPTRPFEAETPAPANGIADAAYTAARVDVDTAAPGEAPHGDLEHAPDAAEAAVERGENTEGGASSLPQTQVADQTAAVGSTGAPRPSGADDNDETKDDGTPQ